MVERHRSVLRKRIHELEEELEKKDEALEFYAKPENHWPYYDGTSDESDVDRDGGDKAIAALPPILEEEG